MSCEDVTIIVEETTENIEFQFTETVENVTVVISESSGVSKHSELTLDDGTNPHGTTKIDLGLSNVPNLDTTNAVNNAHTHANKTILDQITEAFTTAIKSTYDNAVSSLNALLLTGQRLITNAEITKLSNTSGTNTGDQDLSGLMVKSNNLSDVQSVSTARNNLGLGSLSTQNGTFSGSSSGTNTGDETTLSIQTKRPIKTVDNQSLEGVGNITTTMKLTKVEILSSALTTQDKAGFLTYINSVAPFSIANNERVRYVVTDTGQIFDIEVNNRSVGSGQIALTSSQITLSLNDNCLQRYWYSLTANTLNTTLMQVNNTNAFTVAGTASVVPRGGTTYYNSIAMNNYVSATTAGSNCGVKNNNQGDGSHLEGYDTSFVFANNDTNVNCETTVGFYGLLSAIPNIAKSSYTTDFVGIGNDVGDTNLSFYSKRIEVGSPSFIKIDCGSAFPAHTTTDAYLFRMQASRGVNQSARTLKMTITNIVTGAVFEHTFTGNQTPQYTQAICFTVNRSNRNTGVSTNIRFSKWHLTKFIY